MKFVDEARIVVRGGDGGDGCVSFHRARFIPKGGPDGGDGGDGGSVFLVADARLNTLGELQRSGRFGAARGRPGMGANRNGKNGEDLLIPVPPGTCARDEETLETIGEVERDGERLLVACGGTGGQGNPHFKSATHRAPRVGTPGDAGETRALLLEMALRADVALVGPPNSGKSSLLNALSGARLPAADYPFTTRRPTLAAVRVGRWDSFIAADLPGLIEGSAQGAGLGAGCLKHARKARLLLQIVEAGDEETMSRAARVVEREMAAFDAALIERPRWLAVTKCDLLDDDARRALAERGPDGWQGPPGWRGPIFATSATSGLGLDALKNACMEFLNDDARG